jgi:hypothetical protein
VEEKAGNNIIEIFYSMVFLFLFLFFTTFIIRDSFQGEEKRLKRKGKT